MIQEERRRKAGQSLIDCRTQIRSAVVTIKAKIQTIQELRAIVDPGVKGGDYDQVDLDQIDASLKRYAQFQPYLDAYLALPQE